MSKRGENIYKRSDGRYEGRYKCGFTENGKTIYKSVYAKTYKECKIKLLDAITGYEDSKKNCHKSMTVNELFGMWFDTISLTVKVSTLARYREIFKNHIEKALGNMPIQSVTTQYLNDFVKKKLKSGKPLGRT